LLKILEIMTEEQILQFIQPKFSEFIFGSDKQEEEFANYFDSRFPQIKNEQIKSLFIELKEDSFFACWRNFIKTKTAFSLGNYQSYLTQGYQKHIHNITKKFVNLEDGRMTFWVSESCLLCKLETTKFVDEHRENQFKVLSHMMNNIQTMSWFEFFDIMDEARKCNVVLTSENTSLQQFQLKSTIGKWKEDYKNAGVRIVNLCETKEVLELIERTKENQIILSNLYKLRKRNFSGTKEILNGLIDIIEKRENQNDEKLEK
jgi:hypothetical protein